jgi:hypothetical protein
MARNQEQLIKLPASSYLQNIDKKVPTMMAVLEWHSSTFPAEMGVTRANKKYGKRRAV